MATGVICLAVFRGLKMESFGAVWEFELPFLEVDSRHIILGACSLHAKAFFSPFQLDRSFFRLDSSQSSKLASTLPPHSMHSMHVSGADDYARMFQGLLSRPCFVLGAQHSSCQSCACAFCIGTLTITFNCCCDWGRTERYYVGTQLSCGWCCDWGRCSDGRAGCWACALLHAPSLGAEEALAAHGLACECCNSKS